MICSEWIGYIRERHNVAVHVYFVGLFHSRDTKNQNENIQPNIYHKYACTQMSSYCSKREPPSRMQ